MSATPSWEYGSFNYGHVALPPKLARKAEDEDDEANDGASTQATLPPAKKPKTASPISSCKYDHLQFFVDSLKPLAHYKAAEERLNDFAKLTPRLSADVEGARKAWEAMGPAADPAAFQVHGRDLVEQLIHAFGWRVTAEHVGPRTRSLQLSTVDPAGARFVVTCIREEEGADADEPFDHFDASHLERFGAYHGGAQGVGVLGFELAPGDLDVVLGRYREMHPKLLVSGGAPRSYSCEGATVRVLDVFAYYRGEKGESEADPGTVLRFIERSAAEGGGAPLPGFSPVAAEFEGGVLPAYCDHWVSNVRSRVGFLETLHETLGFAPKVDFNAGVVAAGEAQIESTVMGNSSDLVTTDAAMALTDRGQVFLPTNNALSPVGHVHWYLEQLGQGIQHVASRVASLPEYVQRANDYRAVTGEGFTFLNIPRTYYGLLERPLLMQGGTEAGELLGDAPAGLSPEHADEVIAALGRAGLCDAAGAVDLTADGAAIDAALTRHSESYRSAFDAPTRGMVCRVVARSRYVNLWRLMRDQLPEPTYLKIVRNKILIDVQGEDVLMQIFTSVVLQRTPGTEAPFLEFIQRLCAQGADGAETSQPIKPGCGGFGIRNFLTLFLSIEVSKAMLDRTKAEERDGGAAEAAHHAQRVQLFTEQLVESNPILTEISDAMTAEGRALERGDAAAAAAAAAQKDGANKRLQECSAKYNGAMKALRERGWEEERASAVDADDVSMAAAEDALPRVSAFEAAKPAAPDPILSMREAFNADPAERKLNLAVGVYRTAEGAPLVLKCVQEAEVKLLADQAAGKTFKEYLPPDGHASFTALSLRLLLGDAVDTALAEGRVAAAQSISGTGGLSLAAKMLAQLMPGCTVHLPAPTWPIHPDIFEIVGLKVARYPYYSAATGGLDLPAMLAHLRGLPLGSVVLLHACAHNPTGVDPTPEQWAQIAQVVQQRRLVVLVDAAYQGLASGDLDEDAAGARALAAVPGVEMVLVQSYSKNMGLYAERAGVVALLCSDAAVAQRVQQQLSRTIRLTHSSPPQHGAAIAATILGDPARSAAWRAELKGMAERLRDMRAALYAALERIECPPPSAGAGWRHVLEQRGMFCYSGLTAGQVAALRERHHVYMPADGRISMAGLTHQSCEFLAQAIKAVLTEM